MLFDLYHCVEQVIFKLALLAFERVDFALDFLEGFRVGNSAAVEIGVGALGFLADSFDFQFEIAGARLPGFERFFGGIELSVARAMVSSVFSRVSISFRRVRRCVMSRSIVWSS